MLLRKIDFIYACLLTLSIFFAPQAHSRTKLENKIIDTLFGQGLKEASCSWIRGSLRQGTKHIDQNLNNTINTLKKGLQTQNADLVQGTLHQKIRKNAKPAILDLIGRLNLTIEPPYEVSSFRIWALYTVDGSTTGIPCYSDDITIWPQYGYDVQFGVWLQVAGAKELGRVFALIIPSKNHWYVGGLHYQQWTHNGQNYKMWLKAAEAERKANLLGSAYIKYDISQKLMNGDIFFRIDAQEGDKEELQRKFPGDIWEIEIKRLLKGWNVVYLSSLLTKNGAGLLVRVKVRKELSTNSIRKDCKNILKRLQKEKWMKKLTGIRCSYILPNEAEEVDGKLGGIYIAK